MEIDKKIVDFITQHHVLTLATSVDNIPYTANCFYAYDEPSRCFIFSSDEDTRHIADVQKNALVAGSIVLETNTVGKIQGLQFQGVIEKNIDDNIKKKYLKRFPYARLMETTLWTLKLSFVKYTDNRLGFGKKLIQGTVK